VIAPSRIQKAQEAAVVDQALGQGQVAGQDLAVRAGQDPERALARAWLDAGCHKQPGHELGDGDVRKKGDLPAPALAFHGQEQLL
jgi:hypothetical protein